MELTLTWHNVVVFVAMTGLTATDVFDVMLKVRGVDQDVDVGNDALVQ